MPRLIRQADFRAPQNLSFCYLCGQSVDRRTDTREHVVARSIFKVEDRTPPLILPAHKGCNNSRSGEDETIAQLVGLLHHREDPRALERWQLSVGQVAGNNDRIGLIQGHDLLPMFWRWISGFHAALYGQYIPTGYGTWQLHLPLPHGHMENGRVRQQKIPIMYPTIVEELKKNFIADQFDQALCFNGKCDYRCVWVRADRGQWICMFALRLYNWEDLGAPQMGARRGCVGAYQSAHGYPEGASRGTNLVIPLPQAYPLDPFSVLAS